MRFTEVLERFGDGRPFTSADLLDRARRPGTAASLRVELHRWCARGQLQRMGRRHFIVAASLWEGRRLDDFAVARSFDRRAWVSGPAALAFHGVLRGPVPVVTCATDERRRTLETPLGTFVYRRVGRPMTAPVAAPEEALLDFIAWSRMNLRSAALRQRLRLLPLWNLDILDGDRLVRLAGARKSPHLVHCAETLADDVLQARGAFTDVSSSLRPLERQSCASLRDCGRGRLERVVDATPTGPARRLAAVDWLRRFILHAVESLGLLHSLVLADEPWMDGPADLPAPHDELRFFDRSRAMTSIEFERLAIAVVRALEDAGVPRRALCIRIRRSSAPPFEVRFSLTNVTGLPPRAATMGLAVEPWVAPPGGDVPNRASSLARCLRRVAVGLPTPALACMELAWRLQRPGSVAPAVALLDTSWRDDWRDDLTATLNGLDWRAIDDELQYRVATAAERAAVTKERLGELVAAFARPRRGRRRQR